MVSNRCKMEMKEELNKLGLHSILADLGEVEIRVSLSLAETKRIDRNYKD